MSRPVRKQATRAALAVLLVAGAIAGVPATAAASTGAATGPLAAAACPTAAPPANLNPWRETDYALRTAPVRMGPYGECRSVGSYSAGQAVTVNCYTTNSHGNTWSYIRGYGWIWDDHLRYRGANNRCIF
ncbi:hypothetical protein ACFYT4_28090 [Streptomyces sp. NPDC004609]|uniref:hypothetical protein n=1 Tax=Streptomyces sp. NPDC004609 TaxID=3364704 RepID=UPI0036B528D1